MALSTHQTENYCTSMSIVVVGHVDHGKSTIIGRLLADTDFLPDGKIELLRETCRRNAKTFEYAFLLDTLKDEQTQGITIGLTRCFFKTAKRNYTILDAPGHIEFLKNMVTGAARAEAALIVIDANEGIRENSRRHCYMLSLLGIKQIAVLINKMDLVNFSEKTFNHIKEDYLLFLKELDIKPAQFIPVSGLQGDGIAALTERMPWYNNETVLEALDLFEEVKPASNKPFRMPVQDVYKFTHGGDNRRIVVGTVEAGIIKTGDTVVFYPSGKNSTVKTIESFSGPAKNCAEAGYATGFTLTEQIFIVRGELATLAGQAKPGISSKIKANIFWLSKNPLVKNKTYLFKLGTTKIYATIEKVLSVIDASTLVSSEKEQLEKHDVGECVLNLEKDIAFDTPDLLVENSRFVLVDHCEISGGGLILQALSDGHVTAGGKHLRHHQWARGLISADERANKYNQRPSLIMITGSIQIDRIQLAQTLEKKLFEEGNIVYFCRMGNLLSGIDTDLKNKLQNSMQKHFHRLAEVANIMLDAGVIMIVSFVELQRADQLQMQLDFNHESFITVWLGDKITTDAEVDLHLRLPFTSDRAAATIKEYLQAKGIIFKP